MKEERRLRPALKLLLVLCGRGLSSFNEAKNSILECLRVKQFLEERSCEKSLKGLEG